MSQGDFHKEEFSPEEEAILKGEEPPVKPDENKPPSGNEPDGGKPAPQAPVKPEDEGGKPPVDPKPEPKPEEAQATPEETAAAEKMGFRIETDDKGRQYIVDDDGTRIPPVKWKKLYFESHERGRQLELEKKKSDLLKQLGRDEYFKLYPGEAPAGWKPKQASPRTPTDVLPLGDPRVLDMQINGGQYHGQTLREVMATDQETAIAIYNDYAASVLEKTGKQKEAETRTAQQQEDAVKTFGAKRAKELFNVDDPSKLTEVQQKQIHEIGQEVLNWQVLNSKLHLDWEDAHTLMNLDKMIARAREEGAANALKGLNKRPVLPAIGSGTPAKETGYEAMAKWSRDEMARHIDGLSDAEAMKFLKEAPASIKAKFQGLPWD